MIDSRLPFLHLSLHNLISQSQQKGGNYETHGTVLHLVLAQLRSSGESGTKTHLNRQLAALVSKGNVTVVDMRSDIAHYLRDHIPGAIYLHYETLRLSARGVPAGLISGEAYASLFSRLGFRMDRPIVLYSAGDANNFFATFLAWILDGFGHQQTYLLDGGFERWAKEHRPLEKKYPNVQASSFPAMPFNLKVVGLEEVKRAVESGSALLVDARPMAQFEGTEGMQMRKGRIPGSISHFWASDLAQVETGKIFKPLAALRLSYEQQGITRDKHVIAYCNTGTEASHLYFALHTMLGYPNVKVYVPSYTEWSEREELPIETGPATRK